MTTTTATALPVGLGCRPPCLGQECSPIRQTPCGAGRESGSSAATAGTTTSGVASRRVVPTGGVWDPGRAAAAAFGRQKRRRSAPLRRHHRGTVADAPSPAVVQQSYRKVDTWLRRRRNTPEVENDDVVVVPISGRQPSTPPENQLKRKLVRGKAEADSGVKRRVTDSDSCSLPSGTFTSDDEEDEVDDKDNRADDSAVTKRQSTGQRAYVPVAPFSSPNFRSVSRPLTSPRWKDGVSTRRRRRTGRSASDEDVSSGVLGDRSSSLATSGDLERRCRRQPSSACRTTTKTTNASRKNAVERRREELFRRVTRMSRRLRRHRVAAAEATSGAIHVRTLAVL